MTKYYVDAAAGNYKGGFDGVTGKVDPQWIEVPQPPTDGRSKWDGVKFLEPALTVDEKVTAAEQKVYSLADKVEALWKAFVEGDHTQVDAIQALRDSVKK